MPSPTLFPALQNNQLVDLTAMNGIENAVRTLVGNAVAAIVGSTNANSGDQTFTATISGTTLTVGGSGGQKILINSANGPRIVDSVPTATFTVPTADTTNPRHDILYAVYTQQSVSAGSGSFATVSGTTITGTSTSSINNAEEYLTYTYATGTPASSPTDPSGPTNGVAIARVTVPVNSTTPTVSVLLTSMQAQILSGISGYVDVTSNQSIGGNKTFTGTTTIAGMQFIQTGGRLSGPGIRLDASNNVIISPGANAQILIGYDQPSINAVYFGPSNAWGYVNSSGYTSPGGTSIYGNSTYIQNGHIHVGNSSDFGSVGDIIAERNGTNGCLFLGNAGTNYLFYDGTNYHLGGSGSLYLGGPVVTPGGFQTNTAGLATQNALIFGNTVSLGNNSNNQTTSIGSSPSQSITAYGITTTSSTLGVYCNSRSSTFLAVDQQGNLAAAGNIIAAGTQPGSPGNIYGDSAILASAIQAVNGIFQGGYITLGSSQFGWNGSSWSFGGNPLPISNIAFGTGNSSSNALATSGIVGYTKGYLTNDSSSFTGNTSTSGVASGEDRMDLFSVLGQAFHVPYSNSNQQVQYSYWVQAANGSQSVGGRTLTNATWVQIVLDGALKATPISGSSSSNSFSWGAVIPATGVHLLQIVYYGANLMIDQGPWVPQNSYGGVDTTRIAQIYAAGV